tara:strand:- start:4179 stop:5111 length:933 start_codon:yes stop_codon:yes gene_type:complete
VKKIYIYLCGGLGNQLFEYAAAKNLALKNDARLIIDTKTGFITDFRDSTKFSLKKNTLKNVKFMGFNLFFFLFRILKKFISKKKLKYEFLNSIFIDESNHDNFDDRINNIKFNNNLYLLGYFQSQKYFKEYENEILEDLVPQKPITDSYLQMKDKISQENSISIGIRMHENIDREFGFKINKKRKKKMIEGIGGITPISFYLKSIDYFINKIKNPEFFLFSTKNSNIKELINQSDILKSYPTTIITGDNDFQDAYDNLWLMSQCKNFIISNSTLYWWAAYFSKKKYKKNEVICSSNFPNKSTYLEEWKKI